MLGVDLLAAVDESKEAERLALVDDVDVDVDVAVDRVAGVWNVDARNLEGLDLSLSAGDCSGETELRVAE